MAASARHDRGAPAIVWFRTDLRLADNPALEAAVATGRPLILIHVLDDAAAGRWKLGGASRWWLHGSLQALRARIEEKGGGLVLRRGDAGAILEALARETKAASLHLNRAIEPFQRRQDEDVIARVQALGMDVTLHDGTTIFPPDAVTTGAGEPYKVFTPFWRACVKLGLPRAPTGSPAKLDCLEGVSSEALDAWALLPTKPDWAGGLRESWSPGEASAHATLKRFVAGALAGYGAGRDIPGREGTSRLSPHLHFGELSPVQAWAAAERAGRGDIDKFAAEIGWREFSRQLLHHFPTLPEAAFKPPFDAFPWREDKGGLEAWTKGQTGYPIVDAGMRQLWATGWMHNRVRMITASFLIKHLLIDWREGQDWFWDTLVDADLASNAASWQWVAGSGADAAPYFRIFNPVSQGQKFDPEGAYVRRWVPELARAEASWIHAPWTASAADLRAAGITLGNTYPRPIVEHDAARKRALAAYEAIKGRSG